ncbi:MAG: hypothetical protein H9W81_07905 [Enterococcus sp.]|nr:hypothetical protein [Enterococcus sp.]
MEQKLRKVRPTQYVSWTGDVEISPETGDKFYKHQDVFLNGEKIGVLQSYFTTPSTNIRGTRLRRDLKERKMWRALGDPMKPSNMAYDDRARAIRDLVEQHNAK